MQLNSSGYIVGDYLQPYSVGQYECPLYIDELLRWCGLRARRVPDPRSTNTTVAPILGYIGVPSFASPLASVPALLFAVALAGLSLLAW